MNNIACIDVETTGLNPGQNRIIQLSAVKLDPNTWEVLGEFNEYINPQGEGALPFIERSAQDIHHITPEFLQEHGRDRKTVFKEFLKFIEGCDYLTYNGNTFDFRFLSKDFEVEGMEFPIEDKKFFDAYAMECKFCPRDLSSVYKKYTSKDMEDAHNSLSDVKATIEVFKEQIATKNLNLEEISTWYENNLFDIDGFVRLSYDEPQKILFNQGKYRNWDVADVLKIDPSYVHWWATAVAQSSVKEKVRIYLKNLS